MRAGGGRAAGAGCGIPPIAPPLSARSPPARALRGLRRPGRARPVAVLRYSTYLTILVLTGAENLL